MILDGRLAICAIASVAGHLALARALDTLPPRAATLERQIVSLRVVEPPAPAPEPEPPRPPEPTSPPEPIKPVVHERPRPHDAPAVKHDAAPVDTPPVDHPPTTTDTTTTPTFGVTMESTSQAGNGPAMPVGNTTHPAPTAGATAVAPLAEPVAAVEVTKMPLPQGECPGKYTDEARAAAIEGVVVLDVTIDEHGRARDFAVVQGLPHGLTQAAIAAVSACRFSPGERNGQPVPVRIRGYKIRFLSPEAR